MQTFAHSATLFEYYLYPHRLNIEYYPTLQNEDSSYPLMCNPKFSAALEAFIHNEMDENISCPFESPVLSQTFMEETEKAAREFSKSFCSPISQDTHYLLPHGGKAVLSILPFACTVV